MYNIFCKAPNGVILLATLPTMEQAREMHTQLVVAGCEVLTEFPH